MSNFEAVFGSKTRLFDKPAEPAQEPVAPPDDLSDLDDALLSAGSSQFGNDNDTVRTLLLDASRAAIGKLVDPVNNALRALDAEKSEKIRLQAMLDKTRTAYARLRNDVAEFEKKLSTSTNECVALRRELADTEKQVTVAEAAKAESEKDIAVRRKQIADLAGRLALQTNESAALRDDNRRLNDRLTTAEKAVVTLESELITARQRLCGHEDEKRALQASLDRATAEAARVTRKLSEAEATLNTAQARLRLVEGDFAKVSAERARLATALDEANERHKQEFGSQRKEFEVLQARARADEKLLVEARDHMLARADEVRNYERRTTAATKECEALRTQVAELEADRNNRETEFKKVDHARAALMEHSSQLSCAVSAKEAALARAEEANNALSECIGRLEAAVASEKKGAAGIIEELTMALQREKMERSTVEGALEAVRKDFDRLMRKVMATQNDRPAQESITRPPAANAA
jgi:chromosome segregation ATPase